MLAGIVTLAEFHKIPSSPDLTHNTFARRAKNLFDEILNVPACKPEIQYRNFMHTYPLASL